MGQFRFLVLLPLLALCIPTAGHAAQLLMLEKEGCIWCKRWNEEIGPAFPKTEEGKRAPLRRIDIDEPWPEDLTTIRKEVFTPTFILVEDGEEIGRLRGYGGPDFFWFLLSELLEKLPQVDNKQAG